MHNWKKYDYKIRKYVWDYKKANPCVKCGEKDPIVLIFDHFDPSLKEFNISKCRSFKKLKSEIEKCRVVCANCHAKITAEQFGWYKDIQELEEAQFVAEEK